MGSFQKDQSGIKQDSWAVVQCSPDTEIFRGMRSDEQAQDQLQPRTHVSGLVSIFCASLTDLFNLTYLYYVYRRI